MMVDMFIHFPNDPPICPNESPMMSPIIFPMQGGAPVSKIAKLGRL